MSIITPLQKTVIKSLANIEIFKHFYLTGGTALAEFYLNHRYSDDLDFFTASENVIPQIANELLEVARKTDSQLTFGKRFETFMEVFFEKGSESVKIDFAKDIPFRLQQTVYNKEFGIIVDNVLDIACNKLSALFDRHDAKDFVDIYFIDKEIMPFEKVYKNAKKKHVGLDDYWLAVSLRFVEEIEKLPRMIKPVTIEELKKFYRQKITMLIPPK